MGSYRFIISGKVQGVYYRKSIKEQASKLNFNGYVKNLSNGTVEATVTCSDDKLDEFITILKKGSPYSRVEKIIKSNISEVYKGGFYIKY